jgi:hypothetical protein
MGYTLLELVDQVSGELGLSQPPIVIGSANNQTIQFLALAQRLGKDLVRDFEWQRLVQAYVFSTSTAVTTEGNVVAASTVLSSITSTTGIAVGTVITGDGIAPYAQVASVDSGSQITMDTPATTSQTGATLTFATQDYALPAGFDHMVSDTNWDRTNHWKNSGTITSQEWQFIQGGVISVGPRERYRIYNNKFRIFSAITTPYNFAYEYVSKYWVIPTGYSVGMQATFQADTDTSIFPDDLMMAGLKLYFLKAKKLDYAVELMEFTRSLSYCKASDVPVSAKSLSPFPMNQLVGPWSIQDGNWPTS